MSRFTKELFKGNFGNAIKSLLPQSDVSISLDPQSYRGPDDEEGWNFWNDQTFETGHVFQYGGHTSSLKAYQKCPPLTSIINRKAQAYINGKTFIMNTQGKEATSTEAKKIRALMARPNPIQSWKQFEAQQEIFIQLFGFCIVFPIIPAGFEKFGPIEATSMWNIPPNMIDIKESNKIWYQTDQSGIIESIKLRYRNQTTTLPLSSLYIFKDITPSFNTIIFPESRVCSLEMPINNIMGALESRNVLINYRGALGAFTHDPGSGQFGSLPMTPDQKESLQKDFMRYGLKKQQWKFIISTASIKWQQIGVPTKDLMLFEEIDSDTMMLCDAYGYPYRLLSSNSSNSLGGSDIKQFKQFLYQDTIIPEAESNYEQWNNMFRTSELSIKIEKDYSHLPILQEDELSKSQARNTLDDALKKEFDAGLITINDWLKELGKDPIPAEFGDIRSTDVKNKNIPLAAIIGVGGVTGLVAVLTAQDVSDESKQATLEILFGIAPADAQRMAQTTNNGQQQTTQPA